MCFTNRRSDFTNRRSDKTKLRFYFIKLLIKNSSVLKKHIKSHYKKL